VAVALALGGCSSAVDVPTNTGDDEIVNVPQTDVERQSIGNCWLYAHASWAESMHKSATGEDFDISQSYWTYWHWFDQIVGGFATKISTGGNYGTASGIVRKYGLMPEAGFVAADVAGEMSARQSSALAAIDASLASGALSTSSARRDRVLVRSELDRAWGLAADVKAKLDTVFGPGAERTFSSPSSPATTEGTDILRGADFAAAYTSGPGGIAGTRSLLQAQGEWRPTFYSSGDRSFQVRVQRALHDAQPVIVTWFVDFNALENGDNDRRGSFNMTTLAALGPGRQGGHMTVLEDYQAKLVDGQVLAAGQTLDPSNDGDRLLLESALQPSTQIQFFRVKNSWGAARPDRAFASGMPGYHDLYLDYLDGPVKRCVERNGETDTTNCPSTTNPLQSVVLPPGY